MLDRKLAEMPDDVLHLGVVHVAVLAAEIVEGGNLVQEEVGDGDDNRDTNGVRPEDDDSDDIGLAVTSLPAVERAERVRERSTVDVASQPAEDTEQGGDDIDDEDGADQLPRWEGVASTGDEDEPILSERDFQEQNLLDVAEVLDDTTVGLEESAADDPCSEGEFDTEDDRDDPDLGKLPFDRALFGVSVVVSDGDGGQIGEQGDEHNQIGADSLVDDDHGRDQVDLQVQAQGDTVLDVRLHALEDLAGSLNGEDNGGKTGGEEDDVGGGLGSLGGTLDSDTAISLLERWSVVDTYRKLALRK